MWPPGGICIEMAGSGGGGPGWMGTYGPSNTPTPRPAHAYAAGSSGIGTSTMPPDGMAMTAVAGSTLGGESTPGHESGCVIQSMLRAACQRFHVVCGDGAGHDTVRTHPV